MKSRLFKSVVILVVNFLPVVFCCLSSENSVEGHVDFTNIKVTLKSKNNGESLVRCRSFIIDPIDSAVVAYGESDILGQVYFSLVRPLKSSKCFLKVCDISIKDTLIELENEYGENHLVKLEYDDHIKWMVAYYNEEGVVNFKVEWVAINNLFKYFTEYGECVRLQRKNVDLRNKERLHEYERRRSYIDSLHKIDPKVDLVEESVVEDYFLDEPPGLIVEDAEYVLSNHSFLQNIYNLKTFKKAWKRKEKMTFELYLHGTDFRIDSVIAYNERGKKFRKLKVSRDLTWPKWKPMRINGIDYNFKGGVGYVIEFVCKNQKKP